MSKTFDRRMFLRGASACLAIPFLPSLGCARRGGRVDTSSESSALSQTPQRFVLFYGDHGVPYAQQPFDASGNTMDGWLPNGSGSNFTFTDMMSPLTPWKQNLLVLDGITMFSLLGQQPFSKGSQLVYHLDSAHAGSDLHGFSATPAVCKTNIALPLCPGDDYDQNNTLSGGGVSIDQAIANQIGASTAVGSHNVWSGSGFSPGLYTGPNNAVSQSWSCQSAWTKLFGGLTVTPTNVTHQTSVLNQVMANYKSIAGKLGKDDADKLNAHLTLVSSIEQRLGAGGQCSPPTHPTSDPVAFDAAATLHIDIAVAAMACDRTRVVTLAFTQESGWDFLGVPGDYHIQWNHNQPDSSASAQYIDSNGLFYLWYRAMMIGKVVKWWSQKFAYLMTGLKNAGIIDSTLAMWTHEFQDGSAHQALGVAVPRILAGNVMKADGSAYFNMGRYITYPALQPHNNLYVSLLQAFGSTTNTFGDPSFCTGPLPGLTA